MIRGYRMEHWLSDEEIRATAYSEYWNNEEFEKHKPWHVSEHGFAELTRHLHETGLSRQLKDCIDMAAKLDRPILGTGADLACGVFWTAPILLKVERIQKLYGVEYSRHRLLKLSPAVLDHYDVPMDKVVLCLGSFYQLRLPQQFLDFVVLAEAFHHAEEPERLLREIRRVLKPEGVVLILGEHITPHEIVVYSRHIAKSIAARAIPPRLQRRFFGCRLSRSPFFLPLRELLKPHPVMGDHYYLLREYGEMFSA